MLLKNSWGGGTANLLLTDPPYNVSLGIKAGHALRPSEARQLKRRTDGLVIENDSFENDEDFLIFLTSAFTSAMSVLEEGASFYIFYATSQTKNFLEAAERSDMQIRQELIWVKNRMVLGRQDYQWRHEPILYGWKAGAGHYFTYDRTQTTVYENAPPDFENMERDDAIKLLRKIYTLPQTILYADKPTVSELHPTMKPLELLVKMINNSSQKGDVVLDIFGGSGSTMIACEELGRKCRMVELDPHYADVIIQRWENFTGKKAVKING